MYLWQFFLSKCISRMVNIKFNVKFCAALFRKYCLNFAHKSILRHTNIKWYCRLLSVPLRKKGSGEWYKWKKMWSKSFYRMFSGVRCYSLCLSHPPITAKKYETHIRISYQFIFLSTNPSCSTDFSRHLRHHLQSERIALVHSLRISFNVSFYKHTLLCLAHSSYLLGC